MHRASVRVAVTAADRWLDALGQPDPAAWGRVEKALIGLPDQDPVRLAIAVERRAEHVEQRARATPALAWAAAQARSRPFAFDRVVIEHARCRTAGQPAASRVALDACVDLFERRVAQGGRVAPVEIALAFLALALAYRADSFRFEGFSIEAESELSRAWRVLPASRNPCLREIRAVLLEMRADLANRRQEHPLARAYAAEASSLLHDTIIPARRAGTLWRAARADVAMDHEARAVDQLEAAERELVVGLADRQRLKIFHLLAFAEAALGRFQRASYHLDRAVPLLREWGEGLVMAQREHLLGHLARADGRFSDAAKHWQASVVLSLDIGFRVDALQTFVALRGLEPHGVIGRSDLRLLLRQILG